MADKPLIIQGDLTILIEVHSPGFEEARAAITPFAELIKSPEHIHSYLISPLSLWNAASSGITPEEVVSTLKAYSRYPVPENVIYQVRDTMERYGKLSLFETEDKDMVHLQIKDDFIYRQILANRKLMNYLFVFRKDTFALKLIHRGTIKALLIKEGFPVEDLIPLKKGDPLTIKLREKTLEGRPFETREYQNQSLKAFKGNEGPGTGFGTIVLPCGAGKTVVGLMTMAEYQTSTLILTPNIVAVHQWMDELVDKTNIKKEDIGEYSGSVKTLKPITIATYQVLIWRKNKDSAFPHFDIFYQKNWGLIIYDEVHLLPAPVFRVTAEIQAVHRLGLTATLIREDGAESEVFSLVGPKRFDIPWKVLEKQGWIAEAHCFEIRIDLTDEAKLTYAVESKRGKLRLAAENELKIHIVRQLIESHPEDSILIIGHYLSQLKKVSDALDVPIITGKTPVAEREALYRKFRSKAIRILAVSKVANFAIDLPDASMAIQISGTFGSRQEEAQRLGRILRPKERNSYFYSLVSRYTIEEEYSANRQKFLTEQGYSYHIEVWNKEEIQ